MVSVSVTLEVAMLQLLCEGACDQHSDDVKSRIQHEYDVTGQVSTSTLQACRQLRYTPHRMSSLNWAQCQICGHVRQYGYVTKAQVPRAVEIFMAGF